jgi:hypothetical protein
LQAITNHKRDISSRLNAGLLDYPAELNLTLLMTEGGRLLNGRVLQKRVKSLPRHIQLLHDLSLVK